ncbi:phosphonopyruvate decarboxylase [Alteromonas mediterranea]|uniref:phosphonopyruvate decarboxylase n=1 Tax=Alteromonas mediterranea TaxID=314275 RepID=UPI0011311171|nr:phosphonopyruvate decarboxylase [Alteromonas mediterranea]QDG37695.1 phosphonopyruvate decarboxylase [Alteromonas mediterranea]
MLSPKDFCELLHRHGLDSYYGVPDSLLKNLCTYIDATCEAGAHIITANEGNAVGFATGHYLGSGNPAVVYMQNSGLGNVVNPLTSLADPAVYGVPMLLVIGWRGEPGVKDEPQHVKQGQVTEQQLDVLSIPYVIIDSNSDLNRCLPNLLTQMNDKHRPVAVLVRKDTFSSLVKSEAVQSELTLDREQALKGLFPLIPPSALIVSTTGKTSREVFEIRKMQGRDNTDFLTVGGMGHTLSIAMGVAKVKPNRLVVALDGDGSMLMHMGSLATAGNSGLTNLVHVVLNNACHDSVGGQPTVAGNIDIERIALGCGYGKYFTCFDDESLCTQWHNLSEYIMLSNAPVLLEIKIRKGARGDLGRPTSTPTENKLAFMKHASGH